MCCLKPTIIIKKNALPQTNNIIINKVRMNLDTIMTNLKNSVW